MLFCSKLSATIPFFGNHRCLLDTLFNENSSNTTFDYLGEIFIEENVNIFSMESGDMLQSFNLIPHFRIRRALRMLQYENISKGK